MGNGEQKMHQKHDDNKLKYSSSSKDVLKFVEKKYKNPYPKEATSKTVGTKFLDKNPETKKISNAQYL